MKNGSIHAFKRKAYRQIIALVLLFLFVNIYAALGFYYIEGASWFDSFYMGVITLTTVGYDEVVALSQPGRAFAVTVIYAGLASTGISVAVLANLLFEETLMAYLKGKKMDKIMKKLANHIIVCGYGSTGRSICSELLEQGEIVVVVEQREEVVSDHERLIIITGDARRDQVLKKARIDAARGLASTLTEDADNVFVTLTARALNRDLAIVSRHKNDDTEKKLLTAGADQVVSPYRIGGHRLALALTNPALLDVLDASFRQATLDVHFRHIDVPARSPVQGLLLRDAKVRERSMGALVVALVDRHGKTLFNPPPEHRLEQVTRFLVLGDDTQVAMLRDYLKGERPAATT